MNKIIKNFFDFLLNQLLLISLIILNYNISLTLCKQLKLDEHFKISIKSMGLSIDITLLLLVIEILIIINCVNVLKNKKNKVKCL